MIRHGSHIAYTTAIIVGIVPTIIVVSAVAAANTTAAAAINFMIIAAAVVAVIDFGGGRGTLSKQRRFIWLNRYICFTCRRRRTVFTDETERKRRKE